MPLHPFENETESLQLEDLTIENRVDRVVMYGSIDLTKDQQGLARAKKLQALLNQVVGVLEADPALPEQVSIDPPDLVDNPFLKK